MMTHFAFDLFLILLLGKHNGCCKIVKLHVSTPPEKRDDRKIGDLKGKLSASITRT